LHLDGTADSAQVKTRLMATGVHRAEFAPAAPMDFDANCGFTYHNPSRAVEKLVCDSPLGDGHIRLAGDLPGDGASPRLSVELDRIPVAAGLDALRTVRSGFGPGLEARGLVSGKINYAADAKDDSATATTARVKPGKAEGKTGSKREQAAGVTAVGPLTGSFTVEGFQLSGDGLREPILVPRLVLEPAPDAKRAVQTMDMKAGIQYAGGPSALVATMAVPAGGATPLTVTTRLAVSGYQVTVKGPAAIARARELAHLAGMADAGMLDGLAGDAAGHERRAGCDSMGSGGFLVRSREGDGECRSAGKLRAQTGVRAKVHGAVWRAGCGGFAGGGSGRARAGDPAFGTDCAFHAGVGAGVAGIGGDGAGGFANSWAGDAGAAVGDAEDPEYGSGNHRA